MEERRLEGLHFLTEALSVIKKPLKYWRGLFEPPSLIVLDCYLPETEKSIVLEHEYRHYVYFVRHKWLRAFFYSKFRAAYNVVMLSSLVLSPSLYLILAVPQAVLAWHEIQNSARSNFKKRTAQSILGLAMVYGLFFVVPFILRLFGFTSPIVL